MASSTSDTIALKAIRWRFMVGTRENRWDAYKKSPALARRLRKELSEQFGPEYESWLDWLGAAREVLRSQSNEPEAIKRWLHLLASRPSFERFLQETTYGDNAKGGA